ncbi:hypothetical protein FRC12_003283 [Ceratobasidium sp. 428]|nr:hypothetical protein FRC12_003283 [Ceratobasidium sp. 428]
MLPRDSHPYNYRRNQNQSQASSTPPSIISSSSVRYATPASLPPAFGVQPLHMWENSATTSSPSHLGSLSSYQYSESGTRSVPRSRLFSPQTPTSTADWVQQTSSVTMPAPAHTRLESDVSSSYASNRIQAPNFNASYSRPVSDDSALAEGDFNVDGSVPSSGEDDATRPVSKYIDDSAQESRGKRKRKVARSQLSHHQAIGDTESACSEEEHKPAKRRKDKVKQSNASKKKSPTKSVANKPNRKHLRQVESEAEDEPSSNEESSKPPASKTSRSSRTLKSANPLSKWSGLSQGVLQFFPRLQTHKTDSTPLWTYSSDGIARQSPNHRALGCIHFSPSLALGEDFHYWVQVGTKEGGCWELYNLGRQHPTHPGYILQGCAEDAPPCWFHPHKA